MNRVLLYWKIKGYLRQSDASIPADTLLAILSTLFPCRTMCAFDVVSVCSYLEDGLSQPEVCIFGWPVTACLLSVLRACLSCQCVVLVGDASHSVQSSTCSLVWGNIRSGWCFTAGVWVPVFLVQDTSLHQF